MPEENFRLTRASLLVTHTSKNFPNALKVKDPLDKIIAAARRKGDLIVYPSSDKPNWKRDWVPDYKQPDHVEQSDNGRHELIVLDNCLTLVGGWWGACYFYTVGHSVKSYFKHAGKKPLHRNMPTRAIFFVKDSLERVDSLYAFLQRHSTPEQRMFEIKDELTRIMDIGELTDYEVLVHRNGALIGTLGDGKKHKIEIYLVD